MLWRVEPDRHFQEEVIRLQERQEQQNTEMSAAPHRMHGLLDFSNVEDPDIVVSVIAEESGSGSEVAVPIAQKIFDAYYNN